MNDTGRMAKRAGVLYLVFALVAILGEFSLPTFVVTGDAAATARNISAGESLYRFRILIGFATVILHIVVVAALYELLKPVDAWHAKVMVLLVAVGVAVALANLLNRFAPLVPLSGADYLAVFPTAQLEALALASLRFRSATSAVVLMFWAVALSVRPPRLPVGLCAAHPGRADSGGGLRLRPHQFGVDRGACLQAAGRAVHDAALCWRSSDHLLVALQRSFPPSSPLNLVPVHVIAATLGLSSLTARAQEHP